MGWDALDPKVMGIRGGKDQKPSGVKRRERTEAEKAATGLETARDKIKEEGIMERWEEGEVRSTLLILPVLTQPLRH